MINLLPPESKRMIRAARLNVILFRYCILLGLSLVVTAVIFGGGLYMTTQDKAAAEQILAEHKAEAAKFADVKKEAEEFSKNLKNAKTILASEIVFSKLITDIAGALPAGAILGNLSLTNTSLGSPISLSARATNYQVALSLKQQLEDSAVFEKVNIQTITVSEVKDPSAANFVESRYPQLITINAVLSKQTATPTTKEKTP